MTTIFERVTTALTTLSIPFANSVYLTPTGTELPDVFLVYFLVSSPPAQHADDDETLRRNRVQVSTYSRAGLISLPDVTAAMKAQGFGVGPKMQLPYNQATRHHGLAQEYVYLEEI